MRPIHHYELYFASKAKRRPDVGLLHLRMQAYRFGINPIKLWFRSERVGAR
jgi:hypothetical protein